MNLNVILQNKIYNLTFLDGSNKNKERVIYGFFR